MPRRKVIRSIYMVLSLAVLWVVLQNSFTVGDFILGLVAGLVIVTVLPPPSLRLQRLRLRKALRAVYMLGYFLKEVVVSNLAVARLVLQRRPAVYPGIIAMPLRVKGNTHITTVANMITLTPGTLSVELSPDHTVLYVHCIDARDADAVLASAHRFEDLIREVTS